MSKQRTKPAYRTTVPTAVSVSPEFVTKQIAAKRLGLSVRRVLELSQRGMLKRRSVIDPQTKRRQTVFRQEDVERVVDGNRRLVAYRGGAGEVAALPPVQPISAPPAPDRQWLTVEESAHYSGLPASFLLDMIDRGRLAALDVGVRPGGRYRISRRDIDGIKATPIRK